MDHEAYESQMIDTVNRNAEEKNRQAGTAETPVAKKKLLTKADVKALKHGGKRVLVALFTTILFILSIVSFIAVATAKGYVAVILFISGIVLLVWAFIFLYAQGITKIESRGGRYAEK